MAQKTDIRLRRSNVANAIPGAANLSDGELAMNTMDGALYFKKSNDTIITAHDNNIMHIDSTNDRIGIGETSPDRKLHVKDTNYRIAVFERTGASNGYVMFADPNTTQDVGLGATANDLKFRSGNVDHLSLLGSNGHLKFTDFDQQLEFGSSSNTIGYSSWTMSASAGGIIKNVAGPLTLNPDNFTAFQINDVEVARIDANGRLGIGKTTPGVPLHVADNSNVLLKLESTSSGNNARMAFAPNSTEKWNIGVNISNDNFSFYDVANAATPIRFEPGAANNTLVVDSNSRIGIGLTGPSKHLEILGTTPTIRLSDSRILDNGSWDDVSMGALQFYTSDTTSPGARVGAEIEALSDGDAASGPNFNLLFKTASNTGTVTEKLRIDKDGKVGIGTSSPATKLHVANGSDTSDAVRISGGHASRYLAIRTFENNSLVGAGILLNASSSGGAFKFQTTSTDRMTIANDGKVGIGTTSPDQKFHVEFSNTDTSFSGGIGGAWGSEGIRIENTSSTSNTMAMLHFRNNDADIHVAGIRQGTDNSDLGFFFEGSEKVRFTNDGKVGIGVVSPAHELHIMSDSPSIRVQDSDGTNQFTTITQNGGVFQIFARNGSNVGSIQFQGNNGSSSTEYARFNTSGHFLVGSNNAANSTAGFRAYAGGNGAFTIAGTVLDLNRLSTDGMILNFQKDTASVGGIGTVDGDLNIFPSAGGHKGLRFGNGYIAPTGNGTAVENGTTDLGLSTQRFKDIHLSGVANAAGFQSNQTTTGFGYVNFGDTDDANIGQIGYDHTDNYMRFQVNNTEKVRIIANGNVGIGTTTPGQKLDVIGSARIAGSNGSNVADYTLLVENTGTSQAIIKFKPNGNRNIGPFIKSTQRGNAVSDGDIQIGDENGTIATFNVGRVGIGTISPASPLDVISDSSALGLRVRGRTSDDIGQIDLANNGGTVRSQLQWNNSFFNIKALAAIPMIFYTNGTERMRIQSAGNVGIGTDSPEGTLHVKSTGNGEIDIERASGAKINIQAQSAAGYIGTDTNHVFGLKSNSTVRLKIATNGAITFNDAFTFPTSIGSAGQVLKVPSTGTTLVWADDAGGGSATVLTDTDGDTKIQVEESADEDIIRFDIAGTQKMLLNSTELNLTGDLAVSGNLNIVGDINSTSVTNLDVTDKTITVANNAGSAANANGAGIVVDTGTNNPRMIYTSTTDEWDFNRSIHVSGAAGSGVKIDSGGAIVGGGATGGDTQLMYWGGGPVYYGRSSLGGTVSGHEFRVGGVTKLNVKSDGNVELAGNMVIKDTAGTRGIFRNDDAYDLRLGGGVDMSDGAFISLGGENRGGSTSTARGKVEIRAGGNAFANQAAILGDIVLGASWNGGTADILTLDSSSGKVGIGTTSPSKKLHIQDSAAHQLQLHGGNSYWNIGTGWSGYYQDYLLFATNTGEKMVIDTNGNVGIGTNGPTAKLTVVNNGTSDALLLTSHEDSSSAAPVLAFKRTSSSVADADYLGQLKFKGENDADQEVVYAKVTAKIQDASDGTEDGLLEFANRKAGSNNIGMRLRSDSLQLLNGTNLKIADDASQMQFGSDNDMQIFHNGANGEISNATGNFTIDSVGDIILDADGADVILQDGGTEFGRFTQLIGGLAIGAGSPGGSYPMLLSSNKVLVFTDMQLGDDEKIIIGDGATGNLQIFHDGTNSYLDDVAEGDLILRTNGTNVKMMSGSETMVNAAKDGAVTLYYDNNAKLATKADGVDITGELQSDSLDVDGNANISGNLVVAGGNHTFYSAANDVDLSIGRDENQALHINVDDGNIKLTADQDSDTNGSHSFILDRTFAGTGPNDFRIRKDGSTQFLINKDGDVGIGTTSPAGKFHISGNSDLGDEDCMLIIDDVDGSAGSRIPAIMFRSNTGGTVTNQGRIRGSDTQGMVISGSSALGNDLVVQAGKVGIGTNSPKNQLHVSGGGYFTGFTNPNGSGVAGLEVGYDGTQSVLQSYHRGTGTYKGININAAHISFRTGGTERARVDGSNFDIESGGFRVNDAGNNYPFAITQYGYMTTRGSAITQLNATGDHANVPLSVLADVASTRTANYVEIGDIGSAGNKFVIDSTGRVGINQTAPLRTLEVGGAGARLRIGPDYYTLNGSADRDYIELQAHGSDTRIVSPNERFHIENTSGDVILTGTGVGIGTTAPKAKLQVEEYGIDTSSTTTTATTQVAIHTFPIADFRTARFTIQITNTTDSTYHSTEIIAVHDGTTANITEFGEVHTGSSVEATFDADINSSNFRLLATPASTDSMTFKVVCHSITV